MAIFDKNGVVSPLIIDQRLVHLTPHMFLCHRSHFGFLIETIYWSKIRRCLPSVLLKMVVHAIFNKNRCWVAKKSKKWPPPKIQECDLSQGNLCGVRCTSLWSMINVHTTPIFVENSHERPFSIISKANTYEFLTKKWSPPEIQECDLWQGNICGVRFMSL